MNRIIFGFLIMICLSGCDDTSFDCIEKAGSQTTKTIAVAPFHSINTYDGINLFIKQGNIQELSLQAGENIIKEIKIEVDEEGFLNVRNENSCNWVREYRDINLYITMDTLLRLNQYGYGTIYSEETWRFNSVIVNAKDGTGDIHLNVDNEKLYLVSNTIANFHLSGRTNHLIIGNYYSNGLFLGKDLLAKKAEINHLGSNTVEVHVSESLSGSINSRGDIRYLGDPDVLDVVIRGEGKLIKQ